MGRAGCAHACASARAPALYAPRARCPSSLLLAAALARAEHLFSPSPWLPFLRFAPLACAARPEHLFSPSPQLPFSLFVRSSVPARDQNIRSPRRPGCLSCLRTLASPRDSNICSLHRPGCLSCSSRALARWLACPRRARPPADHRRATRRPAWAWACAGAGMCQGYL